MERTWDDLSGPNASDETSKPGQKRPFPFTEDTQTDSKRFTGQETWCQQQGSALMPVSFAGDTVDWTQQQPSPFGRQGPIQLQEWSYTPALPSTVIGISRQENATDSQGLEGLEMEDSATQLQGPSSASFFQSDASLLDMESYGCSAIVNGKWDWDDHKPNFLDDYSEPNPTVSLEQGLGFLRSAELEITTPLEAVIQVEASDFKTSSPTPLGLVLSDTPYSAATENPVLKTEPVLEHSEEPSQRNEYKAPNDGDEDDSDSAESPSAEGNTDTESEADYDTCFGVVLFEAILSTTRQGKIASTPVSVLPDGDTINLYFKEPKQFAGILVSKALQSLRERFAVRLTASLCVEEPPKVGRRNGPTATESEWRRGDAMARILVYGKMEDREGIGNLMFDSGLFFQYPTADEVDDDVSYFNPHLLLRPGAEMPKIGRLSISASDRATTAAEKLDEVSKGRIWKIFDQANDFANVTDITTSQRLVAKLQSHQVAALAVMIEKESGIINGARFPSIWRVCSKSHRHVVTGTRERNPQPVRGGVLADEMGLGKTLTTLALICWHLDVCDTMRIDEDWKNVSKTTLIVVPKSTIVGWEAQIKMHLSDCVTFVTYHGSSRRRLVPDLLRYHIAITTYEVLREDFMMPSGDSLFSHRWHRIVLDEAHRIRSRASKLHQAALAISKQAVCHWCLTGTPIHNSIDDYGALLSFLGVPKLSEKQAFDKWITKPLRQRQQHGLGRLRDLVRATSLRRTIASSVELLPPVEKIEWIDLGDADRELYDFFKSKAAEIASGRGKKHRGPGAGAAQSGTKGDGNILSLINFLRLICDYGEKVLPITALEAWQSKNPLAVDWQMTEKLSRRCSGCRRRVANIDDDAVLPCGHQICDKCKQRNEDSGEGEIVEAGPCSMCQDSADDPSMEKARDSLGSYRSAKATALVRNILEEQKGGSDAPSPPKSIVFSCWTRMLDLVQVDLEKAGFRIQRIDGRTSLQKRRAAVEQFSLDPAYTVMLASIGSAGEGRPLIGHSIDLISASHVHILEPQWNPMTESQAVGRVHRIGQTKQVFVTRVPCLPDLELVLAKISGQYVQWVQKDKLRVISQSLDFEPLLQADVDQQRWQELENCLQGR